MVNAENLAEVKKILGSTLTSDGTVGVKKDAFFRDAFVDGYVFGTVAEYARLRQLPDQQRGELMAAIDAMVTPPRGLFSFGSPRPHPRETYRREGNTDWTKGAENAARYVKWVMDAEGIEQDPDIRAIIDLLYRLSELETAPDVLMVYYKAIGGIYRGQPADLLRLDLETKPRPEEPAARAFCATVDKEAVRDLGVLDVGEDIFWSTFTGKMKRILTGPHEGPRRDVLEVVRSAVAAYRASGHAFEPRPVTRNAVAETLHTQQFFDVANARFGRRLIRQ